MNAAGFLGDLMGFRARGHIGDIASLQIDPPTPEIGSTFSVVCFGVADGLLHGANGQQWRVGAGSHLQLRADAAMTLSLCDAAGRVLLQERITPHVVAPRLRAWNVPACVDYGRARLAVVPSVADAVQVLLEWRCIDQVEWQPVPASGLDLESRPMELELRARLRSRHARFHPDGTAEFLHRVRVIHPQPVWHVRAPQEVRRFDVAELQLVTRWVRSARVRMGAEVRQRPAGTRADESILTPPLPLSTARVGPVVVEIEIETLAGERQVHRHIVQVLPRPAGCTFTVSPQGLAFQVHGARALRLEVPSRAQVLPLVDPEGLITHSCQIPTPVRLVFEDDTGQEQVAEAQLYQPPPEWAPLPTFAPLSWG